MVLPGYEKLVSRLPHRVAAAMIDEAKIAVKEAEAEVYLLRCALLV